ncbi:SCP-domain-containing protein [Basidiobolus meristosporus CBS 931.73]|uniref:SCP-domain-containing protein n=1 Tax=Basidiobolus meristosporus CBS 931.73 TaxID=1314790 RepID=A0A1Y1YA09_9FUNG|nr:SCP-domain-containing protein [Basidiobolus meristosporus CBS 931.73]|eukprot:ORX94859.1 SCP-domain-containing protein [Basidiobolus meristosporus CBS 931.73]
MQFFSYYLILSVLVFAKLALAFDANRLLALVNQERQKAGVPPLSLDPKLTMAAQRHTLYQATIRTMTHDQPNRTLGDRIDETGYVWGSIGENVAAGFGDEMSVMNAWMNSPGHRSNILNPVFTQIGVAYDPRGSYWTQEFARPVVSRKRASKFVGARKE